MNKKLTLTIVLIAVVAAAIYWFTRPDIMQMPDVDPMTDAQYQEMLADMRRMTPEGDNGEWSDSQLIRLRGECSIYEDRQSAATNAQAGTGDIDTLCANVQ